jgi:hypothetical protein
MGDIVQHLGKLKQSIDTHYGGPSFSFVLRIMAARICSHRKPVRDSEAVSRKSPNVRVQSIPVSPSGF